MQSESLLLLTINMWAIDIASINPLKQGNTSGQPRRIIGVCFVNRTKEEELNSERKKSYISKEEEKHKQAGIFSYLMYMAKRKLTDYYVGKMKYTHCEIAFMDDPKSNNNNDMCKAFSVFGDKGVFLKDRSFSNPAYEWIFLSITATQYNNMQKFCEKQLGKGYDLYGMRMLAFWPRPCPSDSWWCVPLIVSTLQEGGIFVGYRPYALDVDDVRAYLTNHTNVIKSMTPLQLKNFQKAFGTDVLSSLS